MKKILTIFVLAAIIFTGCKHKTDEDSDNVTKTVKINRDGEVYLIKLNTTGKQSTETTQVMFLTGPEVSQMKLILIQIFISAA